jgi:hypothetical protein
MHLSFSDLWNLYKDATPHVHHPLDSAEIAKAIIHSDDDAKKLLLALHRGVEGLTTFIRDTHQEIISLAALSPVHKLAVLSNTRIDWHALNIFSEGRTPNIRKDFLVPTVLADDDATEVLLRNPRMDRQFIADIIRGKDEFSVFSLKRRFSFALSALEANRIESQRCLGKATDYNELHFAKPVEAFFALLRESNDAEPIEKLLHHAFGRVLQRGVHLDPDDWVSHDEKDPAETLGERSSYDDERLAAARAFLLWARRTGAEEPLCDSAAYEKNDRVYHKGDFVALCIYKTLSNYSALIAEQRSRPEWCARAGAYAADFDKELPASVKDRRDYFRALFNKVGGDRLAFLRGIALSKKYWALVNSDEEVGEELLGAFAASSDEASHMREYTYKWIGDIYFRSEGRDEEDADEESPESKQEHLTLQEFRRVTRITEQSLMELGKSLDAVRTKLSWTLVAIVILGMMLVSRFW